METFLAEVASKILENNPKDIDQVTVIFNNRRPGLFLSRELAKKSTRAFFLPKIIGINELVNDLSQLEIISNEFLLFELYSIHQEIEPDNALSFERFIPIAETMLRDFSMIDLYCIDAKALFTNLSDAKAIEQWGLGENELSKMQRHYMAFFRKLFDYYSLLRKRLEANGKGYEGMAYRKVAENIGSLIDAYPSRQVYFVGFNALSVCEERIISAFVQSHQGQLLTDGDAYYFDSILSNGTALPPQEAGLFLRKEHEKFNNIGPFEAHFAKEEKHITIVSCPENILQTKYAGQLLDKLSQNENNPLEQTAVVLADEQLLIPMLNALPKSIPSTNITMGFPFSSSNAHELALKIISLHQHIKKERFLCSDVTDILSDQLLRKTLHIDSLATTLTNLLQNEKLVYVNAETIRNAAQKHPEEWNSISSLFDSNKQTANEMLSICSKFVSQLLNSSEEHNVPRPRLDRKEQEALSNLLKIIDYLSELQSQTPYIENLDTLLKIYKRIAQRHTISFYGEPLSGLQILGMLETRNLDFKRIILLSTNEGMLPSGKKDNTLIPYDLKRAFSIPSYAEKDAVYAYHFYRLLQRANDIYLIYNTETDGMNKGEPSRFILQVQDELAKVYPNIHIHEVTVASNTQPAKQAPTPYADNGKSKATMKRLEEMADKGLSPTALNKYRHCPLKFYYENVLRLHHEETPDEILQANELGTCIHAVLEKIYSKYLGKELDPNGLLAAKSNLTDLITKEFDNLFKNSRTTEGKNQFLLDVANKQIAHFLDEEISALKEGNKIAILSLEGRESMQDENKRLTHRIHLPQAGIEVNVGGFADRIDSINGLVRIVDYKSGHTEANDLNANSRNNNYPDKWFQVALYAWAYAKNKNIKNISSGIYPLENLNSGFLPATWNKSTILDEEAIRHIEEILTETLEEIFNPSTGFQPRDTKLCGYCAFARNCEFAQK